MFLSRAITGKPPLVQFIQFKLAMKQLERTSHSSTTSGSTSNTMFIIDEQCTNKMAIITAIPLTNSLGFFTAVPTELVKYAKTVEDRFKMSSRKLRSFALTQVDSISEIDRAVYADNKTINIGVGAKNG